MKRKLLMIFLCMLVLSGCRARPGSHAQQALRVVTGITVHYENGAIRGTLQYAEDEKMQLILNYLRLIRPYGEPEEDPEAVDGTLFQIILTHPDGSTKQYRQKADRYLQTDQGPWLCIPSQKAMELSLLLGYLETDTPVNTQNIVS